MGNKTDWSQYEIKDEKPKTDWSQYEADEDEELPQHETTGLSGVGEDLLNAASSAGDFVRDTPNKLEKLGGNILENPVSGRLRPLGQLAAGTAELGKGIINAPHDLLKYFIKKHLAFDVPIPGTNWNASDLIPHIPEDTGVEKALGLEANKEKGDDLIRAIPEIAVIGSGIGALGKVTKKAATAPSKETLFKRALERRIDEAFGNKSESDAQLTDFKESLRRDYLKIHGEKLGEPSLLNLEENAGVKAKKLSELKGATEIPERKVGEIPPEPDVKSANKALADALESTKSHDVHGGRIYQKSILKDKKDAEGLYNQYRDNLSKKNIKVSNNSEIKEVSSRLTEMKNSDELAPGYGSGTAEQKELEDILVNLNSKTVNAKDVFALKRTLDKMAGDTRTKQYSGVTDLEFKQLKSVADRLESKSDRLGKVLEKVGGEEDTAILKKANKIWSDYSAVRDHPVGRKVLKEGILPPNTISKLNSTQRGTDYLTRIKDSDLTLQKHILSQEYGKESQFKHLLEPKEEVEPYLTNREDLHPHIEKLRETKYEAIAHKKLVKSMTEKANEQKVRKDAIDESDKLTKQIKFHKDAIPEVKKRIDSVGKDSAEHVKLKKELSDHEKQLADKNHLLKKLLRVTGITALGHKFGL